MTDDGENPSTEANRLYEIAAAAGAIMTLDEYQREAGRTLEGGIPKGDLRLAILALGVAGEAGEVADLMKKWIGHGKPRSLDAMRDELGDVLWYIAALATDMDVTLEDVARANVEKLRKRYPDGFSYAASAAARKDQP